MATSAFSFTATMLEKLSSLLDSLGAVSYGSAGKAGPLAAEAISSTESSKEKGLGRGIVSKCLLYPGNKGLKDHDSVFIIIKGSKVPTAFMGGAKKLRAPEIPYARTTHNHALPNKGTQVSVQREQMSNP